jgi:hypothetical protein
MRHSLPQLKIPIVRYYLVHFYTNSRADVSPHKNIFAGFAQTEYSQLLLTEMSFYDQENVKNRHKFNSKTRIPIEEFETIENFTLKFDEHSFIEMVVLEYREMPANIIIADLSEEIIESCEILYLFYKGAIYPGIHKLDMMIENGIPSMIPLRELLSRALPDKLKINILAEYQLMNFDREPNDFIDFNLIWFLGKMDLESVDKFLQEEELRMEESRANPEDEQEEEKQNFIDSLEESFSDEDDEDFGDGQPAQPLNEHDQMIKIELENELKKFYLTEAQFFTRVVGLRHYDFNILDLSEGVRVALTHEPDNPFDEYAVSVTTTNGNMIGYLKKELSEIMYSEIKKGVLFKATVVKVIPEATDSNSRVHLLIQKMMHHFN